MGERTMAGPAAQRRQARGCAGDRCARTPRARAARTAAAGGGTALPSWFGGAEPAGHARSCNRFWLVLVGGPSGWTVGTGGGAAAPVGGPCGGGRRARDVCGRGTPGRLD